MKKIEPFNIIDERVIEPKGYYARTVHRGQVIRITDIDGQQVPDFLCFDVNRPLEHKLSVENTLLVNGTIYITTGHTLYSTECRPMFSIIDDTCGRHDLICGSCSEFTNAFRYGVRGTANCRTNFELALSPFGIPLAAIPYSFNIFMNAPVKPDGSIAIIEPESKPGDYIELKAEMDCIIAISNCPQERNPCNAYKVTSLGFLLYEPDPVPGKF